MARQKISNREISAAFETVDLNQRFPPILTIQQVAELCQCSKSSVYRWSSEGQLDFAKTARGPVRFWRDKIIAWIFGERGN